MLIDIAEALLEREVLDADEIQTIIEGRSFPPAFSPDSTDDGRRAAGAETGAFAAAGIGSGRAAVTGVMVLLCIRARL